MPWSWTGVGRGNHPRPVEVEDLRSDGWNGVGRPVHQQCLSGYPPFSDQNAQLSLNEQITRGEFFYSADKWKHVSKEAFDLVQKLLTVDTGKRLKIEEALVHPWLQDKNMKHRFQQLLMKTNDLVFTPEVPVWPPTSRKRPHEKEELPAPKRPVQTPR